MATVLYCTNDLADLTIAGNVVRKLSLSRGAGLVSKTWTTDATTPESVYDTGTTPLVFAFRYAEEHTTTIADDPVNNVWGLESNAMANYGPSGDIHLYNDDGTLFDDTYATIGTVGAEWGTAAAVRTYTMSQFAQTSAANKWIVFFPRHAASGGTAASGYTLTWSYGATSAGVDGDTYLTLVPTLTESFASAGANPRPMSTVLQAVNRASRF